MTLLAGFVRLLARIFRSLAELCLRVSSFFNGFLPVLLSLPQLTALVKEHYHSAYSERIVRDGRTTFPLELFPWESEIFDRFHPRSGRMLILGSGLGREAIAIAQKGVTVVGVDASQIAVRTAHQVAKTLGVPAHFHQADYLELPYDLASFDTALLSNVMFSAIPSVSWRQAWLAQLRRILKPNGLAILSFCCERSPAGRLKTAQTCLNRILAKLPGTNSLYEPGDGWETGHFIHAFQSEDEIRNELIGAGAFIWELDWARGFAVITYPPRPS